MDRRSTSDQYTHYQGDVTAQVGSSHGVRLSGGSTGGIVEAVGDDTNVSLLLRGQGTGIVTVGSAGGGNVTLGVGAGGTVNVGAGGSSPINLRSSGAILVGSSGAVVTLGSSGGVVQVGSTAPWQGFVRLVSTALGTPNLSTALGSVVESSLAFVSANSSCVALVTNVSMTTAIMLTGVRIGSTADEVNLVFAKTGASTLAVSATTATFNITLIRY